MNADTINTIAIIAILLGGVIVGAFVARHSR